MMASEERVTISDDMAARMKLLELNAVLWTSLPATPSPHEDLTCACDGFGGITLFEV